MLEDLLGVDLLGSVRQGLSELSSIPDLPFPLSSCGLREFSPAKTNHIGTGQNVLGTWA